MMATVADIKQAIIDLPKDEYRQLTSWLREYDWESWDRQIEEDSASGKLDHLAAQAEAAKRQGTLKDL